MPHTDKNIAHVLGSLYWRNWGERLTRLSDIANSQLPVSITWMKLVSKLLDMILVDIPIIPSGSKVGLRRCREYYGSIWNWRFRFWIRTAVVARQQLGLIINKSWKLRHTMQMGPLMRDDTHWKENIFANALECSKIPQPIGTQSANVPRILPRLSAPRPPKEPKCETGWHWWKETEKSFRPQLQPLRLQ